MRLLSRELEARRKRASAHIDEAKRVLDENAVQLDHNLGLMVHEEKRVQDLSHRAPSIIEDLDRQFKEKTKLTDADVAFLFLALALQCVRQYVIPNNSFFLEDKGGLKSSQRGDKLMGDLLGIDPLLPPSKIEMLTESVPYDAIRTGIHVDNTGLSGTTHRYRTLGHDPILGWAFGTANIMTRSLTKYDFETFLVKNNIIVRHYPSGVGGMLQRAGQYTQEDPGLLVTAVARQAIHFGSDYFTKQGLPLPLITTANNDVAKLLIDNHINLWSVTRGAALASLINFLIATIHRFFYNEAKDGTTSMYEVRTRKILSYSNAMATASNVVVTAVTKDLGRLDVGGMAVTLYRLISDYKFIQEIKRDFLKNEIYKMVVGTPYDFMEGK